MRSAELPKEEIQAAAFVRAHPELDGRGVLVGVLDTGVDPGAAGLQTTTDGRRKIVDLVDCTGSGDVDTSHVARPSADGALAGLTGRPLRLPAEWPPAADGRYHLGVKQAFQLLPRGVTARVRAERKARFARAQRGALARAQAELAVGGGGGTSVGGADAGEEGASDDAALIAARGRLRHKELKARVAALEKADGAFADLGPVYDVLAFADAAGRWHVCVDTSEAGELGVCALLEPYRIGHEYGTLDADSNLNFAVDVLADGARVVLSVDAGAHGTHVAGIIGAHFPDRPELNGIAPGCQIVGLKVGDTRLGSMETGAALVRALGAAIERGCDVINLSYGEFASVDDTGRFAAMAERAVHEYGLIFVTSAGNNGPALTTGGAPGTADAPIAVGALVSARMMVPLYSLRAALPDIQYTWSSRGPTADGALNVAISAPGGAIAPVPTWTLQGRQLMNGTSMAAPNATGGIALLLSSLKARGGTANPTLVRRALEVTAAHVPNTTDGGTDRWALGRGLLQVQAADAWLREHAGYAPAYVRFRVRATVHGAGSSSGQPASHFAHSLNGGGRGVYLREPQHTAGAEAVVDVDVRPELPRAAPAAAKVALDLSVRLTPSAPWLGCARRLALSHGGKSFQLKASLKDLPAGAHYAEIVAHDEAAPPGAGALFVVPVTVCKPHADLRAPGAPWRVSFERVPFSPGAVQRWFIVPHAGATWATARLRARARARADGGAAPRIFEMHAVQLLAQRAVRESEASARVSLALPAADDGGAPPAEFVKSFAVHGGVTLELVVAQFWHALGDADVDVLIEFGGLRPAADRLLLDARELFATQNLCASFRRTVVEPEGSLTALRRALRPVSSKLVTPMPPCAGAPGRGDVWPPPPAPGRAAPAAPAGAPAGADVGDARGDTLGYVGYELVLSYRAKLKDGADALTVRFPSLTAAGLYESSYEAQLCALFDANKKLLHIGDFYTNAVKVPSGELEVRLVVRHDSVAHLHKLASMACVLEIKLSSAIKLEVAHSRAAAMADVDLLAGGSAPPVRLPLEAGTHCALHVRTPPQPEIAEPGDLLIGSITYAKGSNAEDLGSGRRPGGWPVAMVCVAQPLKELPREGEPKPHAPPPVAPDCADETSDEAFARAALALRLTQLGLLSKAALSAAGKVTAGRGAGAPAAQPAPVDGAAATPGAPADGAADAAAVAAAAASAARYAAHFERLCADAAALGAGAPAEAPAPARVRPPSLLLRAHLAHAQHCDGLANRADPVALADVVRACDGAIAQIDVPAMAAPLAMAADADDSLLSADKDAATELKEALVSALRTKAFSLADLAKLDAQAAPPAPPAADGGGGSANALRELDGAMRALHLWAPPTEHAKLSAAWHGVHGRHALALAALDEALGKEKSAPAKADVEAKLAPLRALGWAHLAAAVQVELLVNYPTSYPPGF